MSIVDGVDVCNCDFYMLNGICYAYTGTLEEIRYCMEYANCYYKQLKRNEKYYKHEKV